MEEDDNDIVLVDSAGNNLIKEKIDMLISENEKRLRFYFHR